MTLVSRALKLAITFISTIQTCFFTRYALLTTKAGKGLRVNAKCSFGQRTIIGSDCNFNGMVVIGYGSTVIGDHFHSGPDILVITSSHNYKSNQFIPYDDKEIVKDVIIGEYVWLGARVTLLPGTRIGDGAIVQAGSVVHGSIPACSIVGGNPAVVIGHRDAKVFEYLRLLQRAI